MDLLKYRESKQEIERVNDLFNLMGHGGFTVLDIGARDGYLSCKLLDKFIKVTALDLNTPDITNKNIECVAGNVCALNFDDNSFDLVLCTEVLEHIPTNLLQKACSEISRVAKKHVIIGVPYKQDIRVGRTTCFSCGGISPPWGHVNVFDEKNLERLFSGLRLNKVSYVGLTTMRTNCISAYLMDFAGNPYGTYDQEEPCMYCGTLLKYPPNRNLLKKIATKLAVYIDKLGPFSKIMRPNWIHIDFEKDI